MHRLSLFSHCLRTTLWLLKTSVFWLAPQKQTTHFLWFVFYVQTFPAWFGIYKKDVLACHNLLQTFPFIHSNFMNTVQITTQIEATIPYLNKKVWCTKRRLSMWQFYKIDISYIFPNRCHTNIQVLMAEENGAPRGNPWKGEHANSTLCWQGLEPRTFLFWGITASYHICPFFLSFLSEYK